MDTGLALTLVIAFVAIVAALEGGYMLWNDARGPEVQRMERRMRMVSAGRAGTAAAELLKRRQGEDAPWLDRLLMALPRVSQLDRFIVQAGLQVGVGRLGSVMLGLAVMGLLVALLARAPVGIALVIGVGCGALPLLWVSVKRERRMRQIEQQLPDAIDLIARALRAGHSFPAAVQMVAEESPEPLAAEFRIAHDEVNFGLALDEAFRNLANRVPSDDMRFFVIAVLLQRETGGNLSEVLGNIANLVRSRFKLLAKVRVLSAEGRLSAWILSAMPLVIGAIINIMNPAFMSLLWTDPVGINLIYTCLILFVVGVFWMWRLIKIKV
jgi:tight adherence protein B